MINWLLRDRLKNILHLLKNSLDTHTLLKARFHVQKIREHSGLVPVQNKTCWFVCVARDGADRRWFALCRLDHRQDYICNLYTC